MKYKTARQTGIIYTFIFFLFCIGIGLYVIMGAEEGEIYPYIFALCTWLIGILLLVYSLSYDLKRNSFKENGICIPGRIIGAERVVSGDATYFLKILFYDEGERIWYTHGYTGNPNKILKECKCNIYKWKGKYIEADFNTLDKEEIPLQIIPIKLIWSYPFFRIGKVKESNE
ncbi:MAG: hypothetical protein IJ600_01180 [Lachnospiraceae bacterium]|nr:hypothetical protein [Lachnospiraceae bacterium]